MNRNCSHCLVLAARFGEERYERGCERSPVACREADRPCRGWSPAVFCILPGFQTWVAESVRFGVAPQSVTVGMGAGGKFAGERVRAKTSNSGRNSRLRGHPRSGLVRVGSLFCLALLAFTILCSTPSLAAHKNAANLPIEHRATAFGCMVDFLDTKAGDDLRETVSLQAVQPPIVESSWALPPPPFLPREPGFAEPSVCRVSSQVFWRVLLLI